MAPPTSAAMTIGRFDFEDVVCAMAKLRSDGVFNCRDDDEIAVRCP
jgi:hypothetical protein